MTKFSQKSVFKGFLCLTLLFFLSQYCVFAQQAASVEEQSSLVSQQENSPAQNWNWTSGEGEQTPQTTSTLGLFIRMVFALLIVVALAYVAMRFLKRKTRLSASDDPFLRHVSHLAIGANRSVDVVTILDHAYILGFSDNAVNLIGQIDDQELVNSMNLYADKNDNTKRPRSFEDILSIFMPGTSRNSQSQNIYGSSAHNAADMLQRQRNRLNEEQ